MTSTTPYVAFTPETPRGPDANPLFDSVASTAPNAPETTENASNANSQPSQIEKNLQLGPIDKFLQRGKIPWKLILDILIILIIITHVILFSMHRKPFISSTQEGFVLRFFPKAFHNEESSRRVGLIESTDGYNTYFFFEVSEAVEWLQTIIRRYFTYEEDNPDTFIYSSHNAKIRLRLDYEKVNFRDYLSNYVEGEHEFRSVQGEASHEEWWYDQSQCVRNASCNGMDSIWRQRASVLHPKSWRTRTRFASLKDNLSQDGDDHDHQQHPEARIANTREGVSSIFFMPRTGHYEEQLTRDRPFGVLEFSNTSLFRDPRDLFDHMYQLEIDFDLINLDVTLTSKYPKCHRWRVWIKYDSSSRGSLLPMKIRWQHFDCIVQASYFWWQLLTNPLTYIQLLIIVLSALSFLLHINHVHHRYRLYRKRKRAFNDRTWRDLFGTYITRWHGLVLSKDLLNILGYFLFLVSPMYTTLWQDLEIVPYLVTSLAIFLSLIAVVRYLKFGNPLYFVTIRTLEMGVPDLARSIVGILPVFFGFAACGTMWFGDYAMYFDSISESCVTLFSLTNGDVVQLSFNMLYAFNDHKKWISRIFIYVYVLLFVAAGWNLFLMIMESIFFVVRESIEEELKEHEAAKEKAAAKLYEPPSLDDLDMELSSVEGEEKENGEGDAPDDGAKQSEESADPDAESFSPTDKDALPSYSMPDDDWLPTLQEIPDEIAQYHLYAEVLCDSIETKLFNRQLGKPSATQAILLDQLRIWATQTIIASAMRRKRRHSVHFAPSIRPDPSLQGTPSKRRSVSFASVPIVRGPSVTSWALENPLPRRRTGSILKTSVNYGRALAQDIEMQDHTMGGWRDDEESNADKHGTPPRLDATQHDDDEPFDLLATSEYDETNSGGNLFGEEVGEDGDEGAIGVDELIRQHGL